MANKEAETGKGSIAERSLRFLRDLHIGLGAIALAGAVVLPQFAIFSTVAAYEGINAAAHEGLRQTVKPKSRSRHKAQSAH
jgi:cobalamin synthase